MTERQPPVFDPAATHQQRPKLRAIRGFPAQHGEQTLLGLADARQISDEVVFTSPAAQVILQHMDGSRDVEGILAAVSQGLRRADLEMLIAQLDQAGLLEGPTFNTMLTRVRKEYDSLPYLPPAGTANFADALATQELGDKATKEQLAELGPTKLREQMDKWMNEALKDAAEPAYTSLPKAIIAPHLDYWRGWQNYSHAYGRLRVADRPDRVIILGTNHFGFGTGVVACDKGFGSPLGLCEVDQPFIDTLNRHLTAEQSRQLFENRYDHEREHSVELQIPWIQQVFGESDAGNAGGFPKILGVLIHDPAPNNGESYDGKGLGILPFIDAMKKTISQMPGRTLLVSSADLSHVGLSFGDRISIVAEEPEAIAFRNKVVQHDREMIELIRQGKGEELVASMAWQQNPTRWCSVGNLVATMKIVGGGDVRLLNYAIATDPQGVAAVSSIAGAIV